MQTGENRDIFVSRMVSGGWILKEGAFSKRLLKPASLVPFLPEQERNITAATRAG